MPSEPRPVFISYASATSKAAAFALHEELGAEVAFLDTTDLRDGEEFPSELFEAITHARVVVCLLDEAYFLSPFCRAEFRLAQAPHWYGVPVAADFPGVVIGFGIETKSVRDRLPPRLSHLQWGHATETEDLATLVRKRLERTDLPPIVEQLSPQQLQWEREALVSEFYSPKEHPLPPEYLNRNLPARPFATYVGRHEHFPQLLDRLITPPGPATLNLVGQGGVGKSSMASVFLWRYWNYFPGGTFWVTAPTSADDVDSPLLDQQFFEILRALEPDTLDRAAYGSGRERIDDLLVQALRKRAAQGRLLWIVDGIPECSPGRSPCELKNWCPGLRDGSLRIAFVATSRAHTYPPSVNFELKELPKEEAFHLLRRDLPSPESLDPQVGAKIAATLCYWPVALELAGSCLRAGIMSPDQFLRDLQRKGTTQALARARAAIGSSIPDNLLQSMSRILDNSYGTLHPAAQRLGTTLAFMGPTRLPFQLLDACGEDDDALAARADLVNRCLVHRADGDDYGTMLPLFADYLRTKDSDNQGLAAALAAATCCIGQEPGGDSPIPASEAVIAPHVSALLSHAADDRAEAFPLGTWLERLWDTEGRYPDALAVASANLARAEACRGELSEEALQVRHEIGRYHLYLREASKARTLYEKLIPLRVKTLGAEHPETLSSRHNLVLALINVKELEAAEQELNTLLALSAVHLPPGSENALSFRHTLAVLRHHQNRLAEARDIDQEVAKTCLESLGADHRLTLSVRNNIGSVIHLLGDPGSAATIYRDVWTAQKHKLGESHPDTLRSQTNLGLALHQLGSREEARQHLENSLRERKRILGDEHPDFVKQLASMRELAPPPPATL